MVAYQFRMPAGIPGTVNRTWQSDIEPIALSLTDITPLAYGLACSLDAVGNLRQIQAGDTAATFYGFNVKAFPTQEGNTSDGLGQATPPTSGIVDVLKAGYMSVLLGGTTAAVKGGAVYVWTAATSGAHVLGQVEAADPTSNGIKLANAYFMGAADASGNTEIAFNAL